MPLECKYKNAGQSLSTQSRVHRLQSRSTDFNMALNSLQTSTGTRISLHETAIIVEHQTGPGNTLRYTRLRTLYVVGVARKGTLIHYAEQWNTPTHVRGIRLQPSTVSGAPTRLQPESRDCTILHIVLHVKGRVTTTKVQQPQDCASLQTRCQ